MTNTPGIADHAAAPTRGPILGYTIPQIRKAIINLVGLLTALLSADLLPAGWGYYVSAAIGVLTVVVHFQTPNAPLPPKA